jgi:hypothetical protein
VCNGPIHAIVDSETIAALQQMLTAIVGCRGPVDTIATPVTEAAFARRAGTLVEDDGVRRPDRDRARREVLGTDGPSRRCRIEARPS